MHPEERAREKIDRQLKKAGWEIVSREEYICMKGEFRNVRTTAEVA